MRLTVMALLLAGVSCTAQTRPPILGISNMGVYATDTAKSEHFYVHDLGLKKDSDPYNPQGSRYYVNREQFIEVLPMPGDAGVNRLDHLGYLTTDAEQMRQYLKAHQVAVPDSVHQGSDGSAWFEVKDPEGNRVQFVQPPAALLAIKDTTELYPLNGGDPIGRQIIHVGMLVRDAAKEDTFYRDLLGFRPYWHGGMATGKTDWVSQQVPDGHDWLEYMLTSGPSGSGIPAQMTQKRLGVLNHFSLGVVNMEIAVTTLHSQGRIGDARPTPQIGRDGKWQYNLFDPDDTRVEMMEFSAVEEPCCSTFTATNPIPGGQP